MKKEIEKFIKRSPEDFETFRINNICYLRHYLYTNTDGSKNPEKDILKIEFDTINGVNFPFKAYEIISRDYEGIKEEVADAMTAYLNEVKRRLLSDLKAGYRNKN